MTTVKTDGTGLNYAKLIPRGEGGKADIDSLLAMIREEAEEWVANNEIGEAALREAGLNVFSKMPDAQKKQMDMDSFIHSAVNNLNVPTGTEGKAAKRMREFVRRESDLFKKTLGAEGQFLVLVGKSGGIRYSTELTVKEYREAVAKAAEAAKP